MTYLVDQLLAKLPEGAVPLFATVTRFEFAMKKCGYLRNHPDASADWHKLDIELGEPFFFFIRESKNAETLILEPPKKQVCVEGKLDWKAMPPVGNVRELFEAVRRVRNNLVHGGKSGHPDDKSFDQHRNRTLIAEAQWVLEEALNQHGRLAEEFSILK